MLLNTLRVISEYLRDKNIIDEKGINSFIDLFRVYGINQYVYPEYFVNNSGLTEDECYRIFSNLVYLDILKQVYKVICPHCQHVTSGVLETLNDVEDYTFCEECDERVFDKDNPCKYVILFYKVITE